MKIDYDRGVIKRTHRPSGVDVYMYVDEPGVYRNAFETEVSEAFAKQAGFDVATLSKQRLRKERVEAALAAIDQDIGETGSTRKVVKTHGGFKIVNIGLGRHNVEDPDGGVLNSVPLPLEQAQKLVEHLIPASTGASSPVGADEGDGKEPA